MRIETIGGMIGVTAQRYGWESVGDVSVDGAARRVGLPRDQPQRPQRAGPARLRAGRRPDQRRRAPTGPREAAGRRPRAVPPPAARHGLRTTFLPELTSATAIDAAGLVDRILAELIVEEEWAETLSAEFGAEFEALLVPPADRRRCDASSRPSASSSSAARPPTSWHAHAASDGRGGRERCRQLVDVERRFLERVDELRRDVLAERPDADAGDVVHRVLRDGRTADRLPPPQAPRLARLVVTALEVVPGGRSKETILVSLAGTTELPAEVIVRKDRPVGVLQTRAAEEFAVLEAVHAHGGIPVPRAVLRRRADDELGAGTLLVMERVSGSKAGEYFPELAAPDRAPACARPPAGRRPGPPARASRSSDLGEHGPRPRRRGDDGDHHRGGRGDVPPASPSSAARPSRPSRWRANGCSTTSTTWCLSGRSASFRATSACTTCWSTATASRHWSTGRRRPSGLRPASWRPPGRPPPH